MQQLVLTQYGKPEENVQLRDDPEPRPDSGDVVVRMEAAPLNPSDFLLIDGSYLARPQLPATVGAEGVGIVTAVGAGVDAGVVGKRVVVLPTYNHGTWASNLVARRDDVVEVPDADPLQLAMLPINPTTAQLLLNRFVDLKPGDWVGQTGANSAVGRLIVALAQLRGLKTLNIVRRDDAADEVRRAGGDAVLVSGPDLSTDIARELGGDELSLVLDPVGGRAASDLISALKFGGTAVTYGWISGEPTDVPTTALFSREIRYTGFWLGNWYRTAPRREIADTLSYLAGLIADGELSVPVEATYRLDDYRRAFLHAQAPRRGGKVLFTFD